MLSEFEQMKKLMDYDGTRIVTVGCVSGGFILTGKRRDNGKWTSPGGHVDEGEEILTAAQREVREEAGIEIDWSQLEFICAEKIAKGRGGFPFVVICFLAHIDKEKATAKNDPDKEIEVWKWVPIDKTVPELKAENRHAFADSVLIHLGVNQPPEARLSQRRMADVSKDIRNAGFNESPDAPEKPKKKGEPSPNQNDPKAVKKPGDPATDQPTVPDPKEKSPADMKNSPDAYLDEEESTGD